MSPENPNPTKLCPTCGTRLSADAARCLVCGTELSAGEKVARTPKVMQGSRMPEFTLTLPLMLGMMLLFLIIGAVLVYFALNQIRGPVQAATATATITPTTTSTLTPTPLTPTVTNTPEPSLTPLAYTVQLGDSCISIAYAFKVSVLSIVLINGLPADCSTLYENQKLFIPHPTSTPTPPATATLGAQEATEEACLKDFYTVKEGDTLSSVSLNYDVPMDAIRDYNGMVNDVVRYGQKLTIPLCKRNATPGPTPTPTTPPPYPAVNLLMPADGAPFTLADEQITLQWASVGTLRENESYKVVIEDVTEGQGRKLEAYAVDTNFVVPDTFRATDKGPHVYRWWVLAVRQVGTDKEGNPIWESAGAVSALRVFSWASIVSAATPTP